jgi:hypothetical protein
MLQRSAAAMTASSQGVFSVSKVFRALHRRVLTSKPSSAGFLLSLFTNQLPCNFNRVLTYPTIFQSSACLACGALEVDTFIIRSPIMTHIMTHKMLT